MRAALLLSVILFSGCSTVGEIAKIQAACVADENCMSDTKKLAQVGGVVASPWGPLATNATQSVLTFAGLIYFGWRLNKKEKADAKLRGN